MSTAPATAEKSHARPAGRSRITERFASLKKSKRAGLVTFVTANDPTPAIFGEILEGLPSAGADIIEIGMPFSDPMADGPSIQASSQRALKHNTTLANVLAAQGLGLVDNLVVGRLDVSTAYDLAKKIDRPDAEAIVLACTNWKTMDVIDQLERELKKPVLSTTQVSVWAALRAIGRVESVPGYGRLLRDLTAAGKETQVA